MHESVITNVETRYNLTSVEGDKNVYMFDNDRKGLVIIFPEGRSMVLRGPKVKTPAPKGMDALMMTIEEALTMASEILDIYEIYFDELREYQKSATYATGRKIRSDLRDDYID